VVPIWFRLWMSGMCRARDLLRVVVVERQARQAAARRQARPRKQGGIDRRAGGDRVAPADGGVRPSSSAGTGSHWPRRVSATASTWRRSGASEARWSEIQGAQYLSVEAQELMSLIQRFGGNDSQALQSAVYELEDVDARQTDRLGLGSDLRGFLSNLVVRQKKRRWSPYSAMSKQRQASRRACCVVRGSVRGSVLS
jgi:hypothetical protein